MIRWTLADFTLYDWLMRLGLIRLDGYRLLRAPIHARQAHDAVLHPGRLSFHLVVVLWHLHQIIHVDWAHALTHSCTSTLIQVHRYIGQCLHTVSCGSVCIKT
jgi:hypothetical protein